MESEKYYHHSSMKLYCLVLILICSFTAIGQTNYKNIFGDSIKEIIWIGSVYSELNLLRATPDKLILNHFGSKIRRFQVRKTKRKVNISKEEFTKIHQLYASWCQPTSNFFLSKRDKDSLYCLLKDSTHTGELLYKLNSVQLEKYLENDSICIDMSVFEQDSLNYFVGGKVIGGKPFQFQMITISNNNDTTVQVYQGNLFGGDRYRDLRNHIIFSSMNAKSNVYKHLPFDDYFSRMTFLRIVLRYIEGKEGLLEIKPPNWILESK